MEKVKIRKPKPRKLLCSHLDLDGFGIITIARYYNKSLNFKVMTANDYGFADDPEFWEFMKTFEEIVIADLSITKEQTEQLRKLGIKVEHYDHHIAANWIAEDKDSSFDVDRCGTKIFWEDYVKPRISRYPIIIDEFVNLINIYDLWKQDSPDWERASDLHRVLIGLKDWNIKDPIKATIKFFELFENKVKHFSSWKLTRLEQEIIEKARDKEEKVYESALKKLQIRVDSKGLLFGVTTIGSKISLTCSRILKKEENLDYLVAFNTFGGLNGKVSFRSRNGFDCNQIGIAKGHEAASGAQISIDDSFKFLETKTLAFAYNENYDENNLETIFEEVKIK